MVDKISQTFLNIGILKHGISLSESGDVKERRRRKKRSVGMRENRHRSIDRKENRFGVSISMMIFRSWCLPIVFINIFLLFLEMCKAIENE